MSSNARTLLSAFGTACLLFAIAALVMSLPFAARQYAVLKHWPETKAQVLASGVVERGGEYSVHLELMLQVGGRPQVVTTEMPQPGANRERAHEAAARFREGSWMQVRYNPADITEVRLDSGRPLRFFRLPILLGSASVVFAAISFVLFWLARRVSST